eukprot:410539_1
MDIKTRVQQILRENRTDVAKSETITLWLNTRDTVRNIEDQYFSAHAQTFIDICGGLKHIILQHVLKSPNSMQLSQMNSLNQYSKCIKEEIPSDDDDNNENDDQQKLSIVSLPTDILKYISSFVSIKTVNRLKNICTSFRTSLLSEIKTKNILVKVLNTSYNKDIAEFSKDSNYPWNQYRLSYSTKHQSLFEMFEADFNIQYQNQYLINVMYTPGYDEYYNVDKDNMKHRPIHSTDWGWRKIPEDDKYILLDFGSEKFQKFIPENTIISSSNSLEYFSLKYIDLLSSNTFNIDHVFVHPEFKIHSLSLSAHIEKQLSRHTTSYLNFEYAVSKMQKEPLWTENFANQLLNMLDNDVNMTDTFWFGRKYGDIAKHMEIMKNITDPIEENTILFCCKSPVVQSVSMNRVPVKYDCGEAEIDATLSVIDVQSSIDCTKCVRLIIVDDEYAVKGENILVFECIDTNCLDEIGFPVIYETDICGDLWELPVVRWTGWNLIKCGYDGQYIWKNNHWMCFDHHYRSQSHNLAKQFVDVCKQTFQKYQSH